MCKIQCTSSAELVVVELKSPGATQCNLCLWLILLPVLMLDMQTAVLSNALSMASPSTNDLIISFLCSNIQKQHP